MPINTPTGYLDITNATLRGSKIVTTGYVGIANANPTNHLSIGSNLHINDTHSNVLQISGNINAASVVLGGISIAPTFDLEIVTNTGNTTPYTVEFNNTATAFVTTANATIGDTLTASKLVGDGSGISAIQSSNVTDFASNVSRITALESSRALGSDLDNNSARITNLSSNLSDNSSRITTLESGDISISGDKTFTGDIIFESNVHMNGGNVFVANTVNLTVTDPIIELGSNNSGTNDLGIIMTRLGATNSNVAVVFDESDDILRMGYTLNGANDTVVSLDSNALAVSVQGSLGIGTTSPRALLDVSGPVDVPAILTSGASSSEGDIAVMSGEAMQIGHWDNGTSTFTNRIHMDSTGNVGIGTATPQEKFHLYGSPIIQHETRYDVGANAGWYKIGTWEAASGTGARLKISLLGSESYSAQDRARGGETIIYASINNNNPTTTSNMSGSIHVHGKPVITQAKFKQVGTNRTQYEIIAYVEPYTQHSMKIECSATTTFTRAWTSASDPGADSATVQAALFTHVVDNAGNVGIGTSSPTAHLHVSSGTDGDCVLKLEADTDNNDETDNPRIEFISDGGYNTALVGAGQMPFSSENLNGLVLGAYQTVFYTGVQDFTDSSNMLERMRIDHTGNVGIGTTDPIAALDIDGGANDDTTPALAIRGGFYDTSDLYVLNSYNVNTGVGYAAKVIGVNIKNKVETDNTIQIRNNVGGLTSAGAIYLGSDEINQGVFGVLGGIGSAGTTLGEYLTVRSSGNVGINDSDPSYKLSVQGSFRVHGNTSTFGSDGLLHINSRTTTYGSETVALQTTIDGRALTESNPGTHGSEDRNVLALQPDGGYVGIGTTGPLRKLQVDGDVLIGDRLPYNDQNYTSAQLILGGTHNSSTYHNSSNKIKLLISGGDNDSASPYYIMCEDENGYNQFWVKGGTQGSTSVSNATMYLNGTARINDIGFAAYRSGGGDSTYTGTVVFNNEYYDHGSDYSTSTGKFTAPVAGIYRFGFNGFTNQGATTASRIYLYKNEGIYIQKGNSIDRHGNCIDTLIKLAANDTVSIRGNTSYPVYFYRSQAHNIFYGHLVTGL